MPSRSLAQIEKKLLPLPHSQVLNIKIPPLAECSSCLPHIHQTHAFLIRRGGLHPSHQPTPDHTHLCNAAIRALSLSSPLQALLLYNRLRFTALPRPDTYSFPFLLKAVLRLPSAASDALYVGRQVHTQAFRAGLCFELHVAAALVEMYSKLGCIPNAEKLFDEMPFSQNLVLWNALVAGYAGAGEADRACDLLERMPRRNVISWTAVIAGYAQVGRSTEALTLFWRMLRLQDESHDDDHHHVKPDEVAMVAALSACADLGALESGKWIHCYIDKHGLRKTIPLSNALIDMYSKSGNIDKALDLFENMECRSPVTWTTMIDGLARHGLGRQALLLFSRMEKANVKPNGITLSAILSACVHVGLVKIGLGIFSNMCPRFAIKPRIEHYGCMIDMLGRAGHIQRALELVREMPMEANAAIWGSLLAASRIYGNAELAQHALRNLTEVEPQNGGNYMLLSNLYAAFGWWNEVGMVRKSMRDNGVKKTLGGSSIEVNSKVYEFIAGDRSHPQFQWISEVLDHIYWHLKLSDFMQLECKYDDEG